MLCICVFQVAIVVINIVFLVCGPGFPWNPKAVGTMGRDSSSHTGGYAAFPGDETPDDTYQPPEYQLTSYNNTDTILLFLLCAQHYMHV